MEIAYRCGNLSGVDLERRAASIAGQIGSASYRLDKHFPVVWCTVDFPALLRDAGASATESSRIIEAIEKQYQPFVPTYNPERAENQPRELVARWLARFRAQ